MQRITASTVWSVTAIALVAGAATLSSHVTPSAPAADADVAGAPVATGRIAGAAQAATSAAAAVAKSTAAVTTSAAEAVAAVAAKSPAVPPAIRAATAFAVTSDKELRQRIKWVPVRWGGEKTKTLDDESRLLLAAAAAERAGLDEVGLSFEDVYGVIDAETSWVPRKGKGRNGVTSHGLAQFEPRTAKGYGLKNPSDPVQAVFAAALYMKDGAEWAADKVAHLPLTPEQRAAKIREGVSVYYNLSIRGRNKWDGLNTAQLPVETQRHIRNVRAGAEKASDLAEEILS
ncbi:lysozyme family protein [Ramlibacter alkalitolerans]|uniref:Transglycosylase SLT domain-containing protein n=1 Tax=Ramlibacter alkalitolerans TaxID=2039631 RepID=A0ABS1JLR4_9BURK|nr:hypothetical protein [Ramlibacter alkalitolerans]MBL0425165.1 hypothetical protein [Ramlibacter alkalitolerans]